MASTANFSLPSPEPKSHGLGRRRSFRIPENAYKKPQKIFKPKKEPFKEPQTQKARRLKLFCIGTLFLRIVMLLRPTLRSRNAELHGTGSMLTRVLNGYQGLRFRA